MKKNVIIALIGIVLVTLLSCGEKKITVKGADGTEYESYQECLAAQDFQAAHAFLAKKENVVAGIDDFYEHRRAEEELKKAKEEVFKQEALFLMSQDNESAQKRIVYLLKEEGDNINERVEMLMDLAIDNDDEKFVKTLVNHFEYGYNGEGITKMIDYLSRKDFDGNRDYIKRYATEHFSLNNTTILNFFLSTNEKKDIDYVLGKLTEEESKIKKRPKMGKTKLSSLTQGEFEDNCKDYSSSVKRYNELCQKILGIAIKNKNLYLAQRIVSNFKSNIFCESGIYECTVTVDNDEVNAAKATLNNAIRNGAFK